MTRRVVAAVACAVASSLALVVAPAASARPTLPQPLPTATASVPTTAMTTATATATPALAGPTHAPPVPGTGRFDGHLAGTVRQVIVVSASTWSTTYALVALWSRRGAGWHRDAVWPARLGYGGLVVGTRRIQGTGTTPAGGYAITSAFGILSNPGTSLPYTKVDDDQWWVEDRGSAFYNQMHRASLRGFRVTTVGYNGSEHLARMGAQYDYVAVIDFNRPHPVIGRGAGIFLHAFGSGATGGCVAVSHDHMRAALRWLRPSLHPMVLIGTVPWLKG